jgi:hypothetical protein
VKHCFITCKLTLRKCSRILEALINVKFEVFTAMLLKFQVFWDMTPIVSRNFEGKATFLNLRRHLYSDTA